MHPLRRQRLIAVFFIVFTASLATGLIMYALRENINLFYPPAAVAAGEAPIGRKIRVGGMVVKDSILRSEESLEVNFLITDYSANVPVSYTGILPDMFAEEQGAVASGQLDEDGNFIADQVLAKHDENYMPPEVTEALEASAEQAASGSNVNSAGYQGNSYQ